MLFRAIYDPKVQFLRSKQVNIPNFSSGIPEGDSQISDFSDNTKTSFTAISEPKNKLLRFKHFAIQHFS